MTAFDRDDDESINFEELLIAIRGQPNQRRQDIIDNSFLKFDSEGIGYADVISLKSVFNASKHPKVLAGEMIQDQVFTVFLKHFNDFTGLGKIDRKEWNDYYAAVSSDIDNDEHFIHLMQNTWNLQ